MYSFSQRKVHGMGKWLIICCCLFALVVVVILKKVKNIMQCIVVTSELLGVRSSTPHANQVVNALDDGSLFIKNIIMFRFSDFWGTGHDSVVIILCWLWMAASLIIPSNHDPEILVYGLFHLFSVPLWKISCVREEKA